MAKTGIAADYMKYNVIMTWIQDCRKYTMESPAISEKEFTEQMQSKNAIHIPCMEEKKVVDVVLVSSTSGIESSVDLFRRLLKSIGVKIAKVIEEDSEDESGDKDAVAPSAEAAQADKHGNRIVIIITKEPFSTNVQKARSEFTGALIINYRHRDFACDKRRGPSCYKHRVMTKKEVDDLTGFHHHKSSDYPILCIDDPQAIWINGRPGDLIEVTRIEDNAAGMTIAYKYLSSKRFDTSDKSKASKLNLSEE